MSAIASNQFAKAHEKLGRNHPDFGLKQEDLNKDFFSEILGEGKTLVDFTPYQVSHFLYTKMLFLNGIMKFVCMTVLHHSLSEIT